MNKQNTLVNPFILSHSLCITMHVCNLQIHTAVKISYIFEWFSSTKLKTRQIGHGKFTESRVTEQVKLTGSENLVLKKSQNYKSKSKCNHYVQKEKV